MREGVAEAVYGCGLSRFFWPHSFATQSTAIRLKPPRIRGWVWAGGV